MSKNHYARAEPAAERRWNNGHANGNGVAGKLKNKFYKKELKRPQIELVKLQEWPGTTNCQSI